LLLLGLSAGVAAAYPNPTQYPGQDGPGRRGVKPHAPAATTKPATVNATRFVFPVVGRVQYTNDWGAPRAQGAHEGNDIMAPRRALAVATEAGKIKFWTHSSTAGCMLYLYGKSGTTYLYIHLNNDLTNGNDNRGKCVAGTSYAPGLKDGAKVQAGQLLGFVGDSGDANGVATHLHFEVHPHDGGAVNPYKYLNRAYRPLFAVLPGGRFTLSANATVVSTELDVGGTSATLKVAVKSLRVWPGGFRIPNVNRTISLTVADTDSIQLLHTGPTPAATTVSLARLTTAKKGQSLTVTTAPASTKLDALLGRALFDAATVVLKPS
jgi:peptidase M23-like protein